MDTKLKQTLEELKLKVLENLESIRLNEKVISLLMATPETTDKLTKLKDKFEENKELLNENVTILDAQFKIVSIINKYKVSIESSSETHTQKKIDEFFNETVSGKLAFNENHPFFFDIDFIDRLITHYSSNDQFEVCNHLLDCRNDIIRNSYLN